MADENREYVYELEQAPYAHVVTATFPHDRWSGVFFSWLSLKGFILGVHSVENVRLYASEMGARVQATFVTVFSNRESLDAWLEHGYPVEEMLVAEGVVEDDITSVLARDLS
jgi:hypothetical protein